jgi:hypothetical protein
MIIIRTTEAITGITSQEIQHLIRERIAEITQGEPYDADIYGEFAIVEAGDSLSSIEAYLGRSVIGNFEWLVEWPCCYEAVFVLSADGCGIVLLVASPSQWTPTCWRSASNGRHQHDHVRAQVPESSRVPHSCREAHL